MTGTRPTGEDFALMQTTLSARGYLRTETAPEDAPYSTADLARNFERIALYYEADPALPASEKNRRANLLTRWEGPIRYRLIGEAVTTEDRDGVQRLMGRIAELTGLDIAESDDQANFIILLPTPGQHDGLSNWLARTYPGHVATFYFWRNTRSVICAANNLFSRSGDRTIIGGFAVIGSETSGLLRLACIHEMIAKSLGLPNGHPEARPSIFNDDGEFALLTEHDEHLIGILYDRRLRPGMATEEAMPIVHEIASEHAPDAPRAE